MIYVFIHVTGCIIPQSFAAAKLPSEQQPYCESAQPPRSLIGANEDLGSSTRDVPLGHGNGDIQSLQQPYFVVVQSTLGQFDPIASTFVVVPSMQHPYCVPAQPPTTGAGGQFVPLASTFAVVPSMQQPYCVPAQPPTMGAGAGGQFVPKKLVFAVCPSSQQPYSVPAHPPMCL